MRKKTLSILKNPVYIDFVMAYRTNPLAFMYDIINLDLSHQQTEIIEAMTPDGARCSVASGHGTGKTYTSAGLTIHFIICHPESLALLTANSMQQVQNVLFATIKKLWFKIVERHPWLEMYFTITAKTFYANGYKNYWQAIAKTSTKHNSESIAGMHRENYMVIVDEASGVDEKIFEVLRGALTEDNNKILLISQFTRPTGHFAESQTTLAEAGLYTALTLNSEESPFVTVDFIREKRIEYGGVDSPEYGIRVLGICPEDARGFLISLKMINKSYQTKINFNDEWGWVATADVAGGEGRDSSVLMISKVCGFDDQRQVEIVKIYERNNLDGFQFARFINEVTSEYENIVIGIDSDGYGLGCTQECERLGLNVTRIHWGSPPHSDSHKIRFAKEKDMASVMLRDAMSQGRLSICKTDSLKLDKKLKGQFSKIPFEFDERGKWRLLTKKQMKDQGIKSPDIFDACAFIWLVDYIPVSEGDTGVYKQELLIKAQESFINSDSNIYSRLVDTIEKAEPIECDAGKYPRYRDILVRICDDFIEDGLEDLAQIGFMELDRLDELFGV